MIISKLYDWTIRLEGLCQSVNDLNAIFLIRFKNVFIYLSTVEDMSNSHVCMLGLRFVYVCAGGGGGGVEGVSQVLQELPTTAPLLLFVAIKYNKLMSRDTEFPTIIVSEYDQQIPQAQTADNPMAPLGKPLSHHETPGRQIK